MAYAIRSHGKPMAQSFVVFIRDENQPSEENRPTQLSDVWFWLAGIISPSISIRILVNLRIFILRDVWRTRGCSAIDDNNCNIGCIYRRLRHNVTVSRKIYCSFFFDDADADDDANSADPRMQSITTQHNWWLLQNGSIAFQWCDNNCFSYNNGNDWARSKFCHFNCIIISNCHDSSAVELRSVSFFLLVVLERKRRRRNVWLAHGLLINDMKRAIGSEATDGNRHTVCWML